MIYEFWHKHLHPETGVVERIKANLGGRGVQARECPAVAAAARSQRRRSTMSFRFHQYQVVGRALPTPTNETPKIYRMKFWAVEILVLSEEVEEVSRTDPRYQ